MHLPTPPRVDVVIPTYRRPTQLRRAIESVLDQTYQNIHITVVDDNDPDTEWRRETSATVADYAAHAPIVLIQHERNSNGSTARNSGLASVPDDSSYVTFLDDDDEFAPGRIEELVEYLEHQPPNVGCVHSDLILVRSGMRLQVRGGHAPSEPVRDILLGTYRPLPTSNLLFRTGAVRSLGGFDVRFFRLQDLEFCVRFLQEYRMGYVPGDLLFHYADGERNTPSSSEAIQTALLFLSVFHEEMTLLGISKEVRKRTWLTAARSALRVRDSRGAWRCLVLARSFGAIGARDWLSFPARFIAGENELAAACWWKLKTSGLADRLRRRRERDGNEPRALTSS